jgi:hypothetical protein
MALAGHVVGSWLMVVRPSFTRAGDLDGSGSRGQEGALIDLDSSRLPYRSRSARQASSFSGRIR